MGLESHGWWLTLLVLVAENNKEAIRDEVGDGQQQLPH